MGQIQSRGTGYPQTFRRNPKLVWEWYAWRRELIAQAKPNRGHLALTELEQCMPKFTLITHNVDGLHQRAGGRNVIELHGNLQWTICTDERTVIDSWPPSGEIPPRCTHCGGLLRPDVVWFGESLPQEALIVALMATEQCDLFLSVGTSALVQPAASLPFIALQQGTVTVEINPNVTPLSAQVTNALPGGQNIARFN